ncbi:hypothetical protein OAS86_01640 [Gammaproteobacteria bacterium]|nr:hypothetical protein [Gammaproteobacteria bacterium]
MNYSKPSVVSLLLLSMAATSTAAGFDPFATRSGFRLAPDATISTVQLSGDDDVQNHAWWVGQYLQSSSALLTTRGDAEQRFGINFNYRLLGSDESGGFLAAGLGWEQIRAEAGQDASVKLGVSGRYDLFGNAWVYGEGAWLPQFDRDDSPSQGYGFQFDTGIGYQPLPSLQLRAGFHHSGVDVFGDSDEDPQQHVFIGAGFRW